MSGFRPPIKPAIKEDILSKVKKGLKVPEVAREYQVSEKTVYGWISKQATSEPGTLEMSRLKRENQELYLLVGHLTAQIERSKKKNYPHG